MFSGIGGFEVGIQNSNLEHELIGYSEIDKYAIEVFERHFEGVKNYGDATNIQGDELPDFDLLVGGFPCQAFSVAGKQRGFDDTRGTLFFDIARICSEKRPRYLVLENVKGLLSHDNGKTFQTILRVLSDLGYRVEWQVLNSKDWGVPQNRERIFIIGYLRGFSTQKIFPITSSEGEPVATVTHGAVSSKPKLIEVTSEVDHLLKEFRTFYARKYEVSQEEICDYLKKWRNKSGWSTKKIDEYFGYAHTAGHWFRKDNNSGSIPNPDDWWGLKKILKFDDTYDKQVTTLEERELTYEQSLRVYDTSLSKTLTSTEEGGLYRVSPTKIRRLTPTECEKLQGFEYNWTYGLSDTQRYKTLGNAVTTNVVTMIMNKLAERR